MKTIISCPELTGNLLKEHFIRKPKLLNITLEPEGIWATANLETAQGGLLFFCKYNVKSRYISGSLFKENTEYKMCGLGEKQCWRNVTEVLDEALNIPALEAYQETKSRTEKLRIAIIIFSVLLSLSIMIYAYVVWSKVGEYGWYQFFSSLVFHGGFGVMIGVLLDMIVVQLFNKNKK